jgi:hypothetical protein
MGTAPNSLEDLMTIWEIETFEDRLNEALNWRGEGLDITWNCDHDLRRTERILTEMGFDQEKIDRVIRYFKDHGGFCDCEVIFNAMPKKETT